MSKLDNDKIDEVTLKLSGIIGIFDLIVDLLDGYASSCHQKSTVSNFAYFISKELKGLCEAISSIDCNS